ncbi:MFS transporter [Guptibacillus hwajinpoensis]|uniref:MFS transporter n=1 Tax=Guptibacillus hwajinpoensis TaxID=208199 RepID=UPI003D07FE4E
MFTFLLKNKRFGLLVASSCISVFGAYFTYMLVIVLAYEKSQSLTSTMGITLSSAIGALIAGLFAGVCVDRMQPVKVLIVTNFLSAFVIISLFFLPYNPLFYYIAVFLIAILNAFNVPAFSKIQVNIIHKDHYMEANASYQTIREFTRILAPGAAAFVLSLLSEEWKGVGFLIDGFSYIIAGVMIIATFITLRIEDESEVTELKGIKQFKADWIEGWEPFKNPVIAAIMVLYFIIVLGISGFDVILSAHIFTNGLPTIYVGYIIASLSTGVILATIIGPRYVKTWPISIRLGGSALFLGLAFFSIGIVQNIVLMLLFSFLVGCFNGVYNFSSPTYFHENIPQHVLGRFMGLFTSALSLISIIGMSINGVLGNIYSPAFVIMLGGTLITIIGILSILFIQKSETKYKKTSLQNASL